MGLDMFLESFDKEDRELVKKIKTLPPEEYYALADRIKPLATWRKANAIHAYFCEHGEEIEKSVYYFIPRKVIEDLLEKCAQVLIMRDEEFSDEHLPTSGGPFFGSVDYDEWFYYLVEETIKDLKEVLKSTDDDEYLYSASW